MPHPLPQEAPTSNTLPTHHLLQATPTGSNSLPIHPLLAEYSRSREQLPPVPESPVSAEGDDSPSPVVTGWKKPASGLSSLAERYLGKPLDKSQQLSDWERRPLREEQMRYAGITAWTCGLCGCVCERCGSVVCWMWLCLASYFHKNVAHCK